MPGTTNRRTHPHPLFAYSLVFRQAGTSFVLQDMRFAHLARIWLGSAMLLTPIETIAQSEFLSPLPFAPNKEAFLAYMSTRSWSKDGAVKFIEAVDCKQPMDIRDPITGAMTINQNAYECKYAFFVKTSPLGVEVCRVYGPWYQGPRRYNGVHIEGDSRYSRDTCRYKD